MIYVLLRNLSMYFTRFVAAERDVSLFPFALHIWLRDEWVLMMGRELLIDADICPLANVSIKFISVITRIKCNSSLIFNFFFIMVFCLRLTFEASGKTWEYHSILHEKYWKISSLIIILPISFESKHDNQRNYVIWSLLNGESLTWITCINTTGKEVLTYLTKAL